MDTKVQEGLIVEAAKKLGVAVQPIADGVELSWNGKARRILKGAIYDNMSPESERTMDDKWASKELFQRLGIPTPLGLVLEQWDERAVADFLGEGLGPWVLKPVDSTEGKGVGMDLENLGEVRAHHEAIRAKFPVQLLEEFAEGHELRIQVVGGELVAACMLYPAHVIGDGQRSLEELLKVRAEEVSRVNPDNHLVVDAVTEELLAEQEVNLTNVLEEGRRVWLKRVSNMSQGGHAVDVTEEVHPIYRKWVRAVARALDMEIFAMDVITTDCAADPRESAVALELNARAIWLHHTFSEGRQWDIGAMIVKSLFEGLD